MQDSPSLKKRLGILQFITSVGVLSSGIMAQAQSQKMDLNTHLYVIEKLEYVLKQNNPPSPHGIQLRLGDLYSEKARLVGLDEAEGKCQLAKDCKQSVRDRASALGYYQKGIKGANQTQRARAMMQMAHLHTTLDQQNQAIQLYRTLLSEGAKTHGHELIGQAEAALGEIYFQKRDYKVALHHFTRSYNNKQAPQRGKSLYRMAWSELNIGNLSRATALLETLVQDHDLMTRNTSSGEKYDASFHEDVSRDLAAFYGRGEVGQAQVDKIVRYSPRNAVKDNLIYLASEADRLGKKQASLYIWIAIAERSDLNQLEKIESQARIAQIHYDLGQRKQALTEYKNTTELWRKIGCDDKDNCEMLRLRLRNFVTEWNKKEKARLSKDLLEAYIIYISHFKEDLDMYYWAAGVAFDISDWKQAAKLYRQSSILAYNQLQDEKDKKKRTTINEIFEGSLLAEIDVAERDGNLDLRANAYDHYLKYNPNGPKQLEVRYQRAHVEYEKKNYDEASKRFLSIAQTNDNKQVDLRKKAADLALDALAFSKDDLKIDKWALEFAKSFPKNRADFEKVSRKARLNFAAKVANNKKSSRSELTQAKNLLKSTSLTGADRTESIAFYKNRLIIADLLRDIDETRIAAQGLYAIPKLSDEDNNYALARKAWAAEMQLDFKSAYQYSTKLPLKELTPENRALRLATLAELADQPKAATQHYLEFIKVTRSKEKANQIRAKLVLQSDRPDQALKNYQADFQQTPAIYGALAYELFVRDQNYPRARKMLENRRLRNSEDGQVLNRIIQIREISNLKGNIERHRLISRSDAMLEKTLKERLDLLAKVDQQANQALTAKDWTLQVLALSIVRDQNVRIYNELAKLPLPTGLSEEQQKIYLETLKAQAQPYRTKAEEVASTLNSLWRERSALKALERDFSQASFQEKRTIKIEIAALAEVAPRGGKSRALNRLLQEETNPPSQRSLIAARKSVRDNPFDIRRLRELRELEREFGRQTMVAYLDQRMAQDKSGG